jgi:hypothetical protein
MIKPVVTAPKMVPVVEAVSIPLRQTLDADGELAPTPAMVADRRLVVRLTVDRCYGRPPAVAGPPQVNS